MLAETHNIPRTINWEITRIGQKSEGWFPQEAIWHDAIVKYIICMIFGKTNNIRIFVRFLIIE